MPDDLLDVSAVDPYEGDALQEQEPINPSVNTPESPTQQSEGDSDVIKDLLTANGISDTARIKFEEDDGRIIARDWKDLSKQEKLSILSSAISGGDTASEISQEEIDLINHIRETKQSPLEYLESLREQITQNQQDTAPYEIDTISDDELFALDILDRYGEENVTDEQLANMLESAKSDADLYAKTINNLRTHYKQREDDLKLQKQQQLEAQHEQEFNLYSDAILREIQSLREVAGQEIELSTDDMNDLANYILTRDDKGSSEFGKALNDPKFVTSMAFWALKGNDIMNEISSQIKTAYEKGVEAGKKGQSQLVITTNRDKSARGAAGILASELDVQ